MPRVQRETIVPYSSAQMFALVNDVARYGEFLPGCAGTEILSQTDTRMRARVRLSKSVFSQSFVTENSWVCEQSIAMHLVDGPFKKLNGHWSFTPLTSADVDGCKVSVSIDFEFASMFGGLAFNAAFSKLVASLMEAFQQRAKAVYGPGQMGKSA